MTARPGLEDVQWLVSDAARPWLERAASQDSLVKLTHGLRRDLSPARTHALLEQIDLRRRARAKFSEADRLFFTPLGLEQATDEVIAAYKATRYQPGDSVADLCCGIGGDLMAISARGPCLGIDRDPAVAVFAQANGLVTSAGRGDGKSRMSVNACDVEAVDLAQHSAWHIDPDRRPQGKRTTHLEGHEPPLAVLDALRGRNGNAGIKLAPATEAPDVWAEMAELEWISHHRECKQLVAWFGELARQPGRRTATVLRTGQAPRSVSGQADRELAIAPKVGPFLYEPDPAVLAAHLTGELAALHGLEAISPGVAYLTGDHQVVDPAMAAFEVLAALPFDLKRLKSHLAAEGIGRLEVKKRGVAMDPAEVRKKLRVRGDRQATLLIAPVQGAVTAFVARRLPA